jgi:hypothetical protein
MADNLLVISSIPYENVRRTDGIVQDRLCPFIFDLSSLESSWRELQISLLHFHGSTFASSQHNSPNMPQCQDDPG